MRRINLFKLKTSWWRYLATSLCTILLGVAVAQSQISVSGTIKSSTDNTPLPGVNVVIKGTANGTVTNLDGQYTISVPDKTTILVFSSIGFLSEEITVGDQTILDFDLIQDITGLEEIVVIGYGTQKKKEVTGAVARVNADDIANITTHNIGNALQGQVSGVNVTSSGAPGENADILIRGISTIGNNSPLYVVDGVPFDGDPGVSPSEIESIDILKDAASCAIYGTRGAAGVILITTKQGKEGTLKVTVNAKYGVQNVPDNLHTPLMNAQEDSYFNLVKDRNVAYVTDDQAILELDKYHKAYQYDTDIRESTFVENAPTQDYNITITGGTKNITYSVMGGYFDQRGVIINSHYKRYNTRANTTYKNGKWRIDASVGITQGDKDASAGGMLSQAILYKPTSQDVSDANGTPVLLPIGGENISRIGWVIQSLNNTDNTTSTSTFSNFNVNYDITDALSISSRFGLNSFNSYQEKFAPFQEVRDSDGEIVFDGQSSYVENWAKKNNKLSWDAALKYQKQFGDHNITAQAIYTLEEMSEKSFKARGEGVIDNDIQKLNNTSLNPEVGNGFDWVHKRIGTLGRVLYSYKSRYMLNVSGRYDGSAKFSKDYRWGFFPSISGAWNISEEPFWGGIGSVINDTKIRISRGTTGNESFGSYSYSSPINPKYDYTFGHEGQDDKYVGLTQTSFSNSKVKWETSVQWNYGIDMAFLKNKISFTAEYYNTQKKDMLFPVTVPGSSIGEKSSTVWLNVGNMTNKGYELALNYRDRAGDFSWGINGTFAQNKNEITDMAIDTRYILMDGNDLVSGAYTSSRITALSKGREVGAFFIFDTDGVIDTQEKLAEYQKLNPGAEMGDLIYKDSNEDGKITDDDRVYMGSGLPDYTTGLTVNLGWRGIDFSMQWYAAIGHEIMNGASATSFGWGRHKDLVAQWSEQNPNSQVPAYRGDMKAHENYKGHTDLWLEDGTYCRLKNITLGYTIPDNLTKRLKISKLRVYVSGQNLITFTNYRGYNPEIAGSVSQRGLDRGQYPMPNMVITGLNLNF